MHQTPHEEHFTRPRPSGPTPVGLNSRYRVSIPDSVGSTRSSAGNAHQRSAQWNDEQTMRDEVGRMLARLDKDSSAGLAGTAPTLLKGGWYESVVNQEPRQVDKVEVLKPIFAMAFRLFLVKGQYRLFGKRQNSHHCIRKALSLTIQ